MTSSSPANRKSCWEGEVKPLVESFLRERGLELSSEKTVATHVDQGFDFLGQNVRRYNGKLLIKPSKKNIHTFLEKVREAVKKAQAYPTWQLIANLNRKLRGWATYHLHGVSKRIFSQVDFAIFKSLWQWALRRHPLKGKRWACGSTSHDAATGRGASLERRIMTTERERSCGCITRPRCRSVVMSRLSGTRIHMIPHGRCTSSLARAGIWPKHLRAVERFSIFGENRAASALVASNPSPRKRAGIAITASRR